MKILLSFSLTDFAEDSVIEGQWNIRLGGRALRSNPNVFMMTLDKSFNVSAPYLLSSHFN